MAGFQISASIDGVLARYTTALAELGGGKAQIVIARAVNRTIDTARTLVTRALVEQTSIPRGIIVSTLKIKHASTSGAVIEAAIIGAGSELPLRYFSPHQTGSGVEAFVWGREQDYRGGFGAPGDNPAVIAALGGDIYHRVGKSRFPIQRFFGPSIPKEMVKDESLAAFESAVDIRLGQRLLHEIARMLPGGG